MKSKKNAALKQDRTPSTMVEEFARLAMELAVLDPETLFALGEEMREQAELDRVADGCSLVPNKIC